MSAFASRDIRRMCPDMPGNDLGEEVRILSLTGSMPSSPGKAGITKPPASMCLGVNIAPKWAAELAR